MPTYASQAKGNPERLVTFLRASIGDAKQLNPIISSDQGSSDVWEDNIFEGLVAADENLKLVPKLAERWETSEDAYVAVLPERRLKDGSNATGARLLQQIEAAWKQACSATSPRAFRPSSSRQANSVKRPRRCWSRTPKVRTSLPTSR